VERVFGIETEYATVWRGQGKPPTRQAIFEALAAGVMAQLGVDTPISKSLFLPNGGRLYFDDEAQPAGSGLVEWATPECRTVAQATLYDVVGERLLSAAIPAAEEEVGGKITLLKNNTDGRHTYGCHENYLVPRHSEHLPGEASFFHYLVRCLVPFIITRQILCAAGQIGLYRFVEPQRSGYQISQRAEFIAGVISEDARRYRPMINTRDEPHADRQRYRRLHVLVGDSNMSAWCTFMKLGTTHLVLSMAEALAADLDFVMTDPVPALRNISYNGCRVEVRVRGENGREGGRTALDIQQQYLDMAKDYFADVPPDSETALIVREWEEALTCLAHDPMAMADRLDWVTKQLLIEEECLINQVTWDSPELAEMNLRYHDIDPRTGFFPELLKESTVYYGPLSEKLSDHSVAQAMRSPPSTTRALIRGQYVEKCWNQGLDPQVDWSQIVLDGQTIALDDPLDFFSELIYRASRVPTDAVSFFQQRLRPGESMDVRARAVQALVRLPISAEERSAALAEGLRDPEWKVRALTVDALTTLRPASLSLLRQAVTDQHVAVQRRAQTALA
jgi:proteasome accessory factor A